MPSTKEDIFELLGLTTQEEQQEWDKAEADLLAIACYLDSEVLASHQANTILGSTVNELDALISFIQRHKLIIVNPWFFLLMEGDDLVGRR